MGGDSYGRTMSATMPIYSWRGRPLQPLYWPAALEALRARSSSIGQLSHPADGKNRLSNASHEVTNVRVENGELVATVKPVGPHAATADALMRLGLVRLAARAIGSIDQVTGEVDAKTLQISSFDLIPSDPPSLLEVIALEVADAERKAAEGYDPTSTT